MTSALVYLGGSTLTLLLLSFFYALEDKRGHRVVLRRFRAGIDLVLLAGFRVLRTYSRKLGTHVINVSLRYGVQGLLHFVLRVVRGVEARVERILRQSRATVRSARPEGIRTHLDEIAAHKQEASLTPRERDRLWQQ